jgi:hypothetical protein
VEIIWLLYYVCNTSIKPSLLLCTRKNASSIVVPHNGTTYALFTGTRVLSNKINNTMGIRYMGTKEPKIERSLPEGLVWTIEIGDISKLTIWKGKTSEVLDWKLRVRAGIG